MFYDWMFFLDEYPILRILTWQFRRRGWWWLPWVQQATWPRCPSPCRWPRSWRARGLVSKIDTGWGRKVGDVVSRCKIAVVLKSVSNLIVGEEVAVCREMATTTKSRRVFRDIATGSWIFSTSVFVNSFCVKISKACVKYGEICICMPGCIQRKEPLWRLDNDRGPEHSGAHATLGARAAP